VAVVVVVSQEIKGNEHKDEKVDSR